MRDSDTADAVGTEGPVCEGEIAVMVYQASQGRNVWRALVKVWPELGGQ